MDEINLAAEKEAEVERMWDVVKGAAEVELRQLLKHTSTEPADRGPL